MTVSSCCWWPAGGTDGHFGSDKIRGHGIPEAIEAILLNGARVDPKVAVFKPLSAAIAIGSGGPFGAEGPIIMTGGAFGSLVAQWLKLTDAERTTLPVAGAVVGMSATFAAPIAPILLAVELLLFEWRPRSLVPVAVASVLAGRCAFAGRPGDSSPLRYTPRFTWQSLLVAAPLGILVGFASAGDRLMYGFEYGLSTFASPARHWMWWPAIGASIGVGGFSSRADYLLLLRHRGGSARECSGRASAGPHCCQIAYVGVFTEFRLQAACWLPSR